MAKPYGWIQHIPFAFFLIEKLKPRIFVELGTHSGNSYFSFCQAVEELKLATKCYAVDTWEGDEHASFYDKNVFKKVKSINDEHFSRVSSLLKMTFDDALAYFNNQTVDLLHIDGLHTYEAVKHDFDTWLPKLSEQGVVIFHDTNVRERGFGVWKFWEELREKYISFDFVHGNGLGVLCVGGTVDEDFVSFCKEANHNPYYRNFFSTLGNRILLYQELDDTRKDLELHKTEIKKRENELETREKFISKRNEEYEKFKKDTESFKKIIRENDKVIANFDVRISNHKTTINLKNEAIKKLEERLEKHKVAMSKRDSAIVKLEERTKQLREDNYQGKEAMLLLEKRLLLHQDTIAKKNDKIQDLQNSLEKYKTALAHKDEKIRGIELIINQKDVLNTQLKDKIQRIVEELESKKNEIEDQKSILRELEYENSIQSKEIDGLTKNIDGLDSSLLFIKNEFETTKTILVSTSNQLRERETIIAELQIEIKSLNVINEDAQNQILQFQELKELNEKVINQLKEKNIEFYNQNSELQDKVNQTIKLKEQFEESEKVLKERLQIVEKEVISKDEVIFDLQHSLSWRLTKPIRFFGHLIKNFMTFMVTAIKVIGYFLLLRVKQSKQEWNNYKAIQVINKSDYFDRKWYLMQYPDVAKSRKDPVTHYVRRGANEGRNPSADFNTLTYLKRYPDVASQGINPFVHYLLYGKTEGRSIIKEENQDDREAMNFPQEQKLRRTAMVITWDVGHNPLGRSYMLAEVLDRIFQNVIIVGFQFPRYGNEVWEPLRKSRIPVIRIPCQNLNELNELVNNISTNYRPDIVFACKTRLPSMLLGVKIKLRFNCPLVVDIDDHELAFVGEKDDLTFHQLKTLGNVKQDDINAPYSGIWTRVAQHMRRYADSIIVSNTALQMVFGGTIVPHVRNEILFDPNLHNKNESRLKYGVPIDDKVVLFFGTPRLHKGLDALAQVVGEIKDNHCKLVIVGDSTDRSVTNKLHSLSKGKVLFIPNQTFSKIPEIVSMADVVCLPQDPSHPISKYQLPAKAIDAIGMSIPLLVTATDPLKDLINDNMAIEIDKTTLKEKILEIFSSSTIAVNRETFLRKYSYSAAASSLRSLVTGILGRAKPIDQSELSILDEHIAKNIKHEAIGKPHSLNHGVDYVLFWKQNDTTLYGRRSDMIIKYLAQRPDTRKVIVFDAPISETKLREMRGYSTDELKEFGLIYSKTYEKALGLMNTGKISYNVYIYNNDKKGNGLRIDTKAFEELYIEFIENILKQEKVTPQKSVFWFFPKNFHASPIIDRFNPAYLVVDVIDDHRSWPNISEVQKEKLTVNYRELLKQADSAYCNCKEVQDKMIEYNSKIKIIPNGCDINTPRVQPKNNSAHKKFSDYLRANSKVIGFVGNLESKINIPLIEKLATLFPDTLLVLVGSTHTNPDVLRLKNHNNILMPGVVVYDEIGAWVSKFSVGILPHLDTALTQNMNPLKAFVYLSYNLPVVSTRINNIPDNVDGFFVANNDEEFVAYVEQVLKSNKVYDHSRFKEHNSWESRFKQEIDNIVQKVHLNRNH